MGADQSSHARGNISRDGDAKTCYYELLGVEQHATDEELVLSFPSVTIHD